MLGIEQGIDMTPSRRAFATMAVASTAALATRAVAQTTPVLSGDLPFDPAKSQAFVKKMGIRYPIANAAAGGPFSDEMAIAICEAGGLAGIGSVFLSAEALKARITRIKAGTKQPFAVGYILVFGDKTLSAALEAGAPVIQFSWGTPTAQQVALVRSFGAKFGMQISTAGGARQAVDVGADYMICQGQEAGGHIQAQSHWHDNLQPVLRVAGDTPVLVSGGLGDGKALREALVMGASGGIFGTRFLATKESTASEEWKRRLMRSVTTDTALTVCFDGLWPHALHRVLRNETLDHWEAAGSRAPGQRPGEGDVVAHLGPRDLMRYTAASPMAAMTGTPEELAMFAGTGVSAIKDCPPAGELVRRLWTECCGVAT
jgi:nitronate monooxygenase